MYITILLFLNNTEKYMLGLVSLIELKCLLLVVIFFPVLLIIPYFPSSITTQLYELAGMKS